MSTGDSAPVQVVVEFHGPPPDALGDLAAAYPDELTLIESKGFGATAYTLQALFVASAGGLVRALIPIIRAHIASKQHISIKADGVEIQGLSANDAIRVLEELRRQGRLPDEHDRT